MSIEQPDEAIGFCIQHCLTRELFEIDGFALFARRINGTLRDCQERHPGGTIKAIRAVEGGQTPDAMFTLEIYYELTTHGEIH